MAKSDKPKLRPYRVDYFDHEEMQGIKVLVHSLVVRAATSAEARASVQCIEDRTIIRAYRYYDKLGSKRDRKKPVSLDKIFSKKRAAKILAEIKGKPARTSGIVPFKTQDPLEKGLDSTAPVPPAELLKVYAPDPPPPSSGPDSPATKAVIEDLNKMISGDQHEQMMDNFVPATSPVLPMSEYDTSPPNPATIQDKFFDLPHWVIWTLFVGAILMLWYVAHC